MTYRLNEIKDFLVDKNGNLNEDFFDELYDLFCSEWSGQETLSLPNFELDGKMYPNKVFSFSKTSKKVLDDYCEGKTQYHYDIKLIDNETGDMHEVCTSYYNDDLESVDIEYIEKKQPTKLNSVVLKECCENMVLVNVSAKCNDMFSYKKENEDWKEASPSELNLGKSDYVEFTFCQSCGKIHFK